MKFIYIISLMFLLAQCTPQKTEEQQHDDHETHADHGLELSSEQIKTIDLKFGKFTSIKISNYIKASGKLDLPPNNIVSIHAPEAGFIESSKYLVGDKIDKGAILATLSHPSFIQLQQKYLDNYSQFKFLSKQLEREKQLKEDNAGTPKKLEETEANYLSALSNKNALEEQLKFMGIDINALQKGTITSKIYIKSPIKGVITQMNIHKGLFVQPEQNLFEIVNNEHMHIELQVFEKDLFKLKKGQKISFTLPAVSEQQYEGDVYLIGQSFDNESKTVAVHGHLAKENTQFIKGLFVDAKIWLDAENVNALPSEAVIQEQGKSYIFIKKPSTHSHQHEHSHTHSHDENISFEKIPVMVLAEEGNYIGIKPLVKMQENAEIVTKGAFYLTSELRKSEAGHGHDH